jgi:hypothetical protein
LEDPADLELLKETAAVPVGRIDQAAVAAEKVVQAVRLIKTKVP